MWQCGPKSEKDYKSISYEEQKRNKSVSPKNKRTGIDSVNDWSGSVWISLNRHEHSVASSTQVW